MIEYKIPPELLFAQDEFKEFCLSMLRGGNVLCTKTERLERSPSQNWAVLYRGPGPRGPGPGPQ